jgi:predicted TIM-barrel fold metal-dependent hydrolase
VDDREEGQPAHEMTTYDLHQHLWPARFVATLRERTNPPRLVRDELTTAEGTFLVDLRDHDPEIRLRTLDRDGLDVAVVSLQPSLGLDALPDADRAELEEAWADSIQELVTASAGRFVAFSPTRVRAGFVGVSLGSSSFADFDRSAPVLDAAATAGSPIFVHPDIAGPADPARPPWWEWVNGYPARVQSAYLAWLAFGRERWPTLRVLFAMLGGGGPFQLERLARRGIDVRSALDPNTFFEVSTHGRRAIELCIETFGVEQLAYGSDTPVVDTQPTLDAVRGFGDAVTHVLQSDTPSRLLR